MNNRQKFLYFGLFCYGLALMAILLVFFRPDVLSTHQQTSAYVLVLVGMVILLWGIRKWAGAVFTDIPIWAHAPLLIVGWLLFAYGLPGLLTFADRSILSPAKMWITIDYSYSVWGAVMVLTGTICLWVSYIGGLRIFSPAHYLGSIKGRKPDLRFIYLIFIVATAAEIFQISVEGIAFGAERASWGSFASVHQWLEYFIGLKDLALVLIAIEVFQKRQPMWILACMVGIQLLFGFTSGFMKPTLWIALMVVLSALSSGVPFRRVVQIGLALCILVVFVIPIAQDLRLQYDEGQFDARSYHQVIDSTWHAVENTWLLSASESWVQFIEKAVGRQAVVMHVPGVIMQRTPSIMPYQGIENFLFIPAYIIPRVVWPGKPILAKGVWFSINYLGLPSDTRSSGAITLFGEGYLFAGWVGMLLAATIFGLLLAIMYRATISMDIIPVYIALVPIFVDIEAQFSSMFIKLLQSLIVFLLVYWLACRINPVKSGQQVRSRISPKPTLLTNPEYTGPETN